MSEYEKYSMVLNKRETCEERREVLNEMSTLPNDEERFALLDKYYAEWVNNGYDQDYVEYGYIGHIALADEIHSRCPDTSKRILDCASGNGFLGEQLQKHGFTNVDALDMSQGCLDFSHGKNVYTKYICAVLGPNRLPIQDNEYDGIGSVGGCGGGHIKPDCLPEWVRITKPGGLIMFAVQEKYLQNDEFFGDGALDAILHKMAAEGHFEFLEKKRLFYVKPKEKTRVVEYSYMYVLQVL